MRRHFVYALLTLLLLDASSSAQNILNNGGFEQGLMCYSSYVWSGDYQFQLSGDSHSGNYSLEIACVGAGCQKAGIYSNLIPAPANQKYTLTLYTKCAAGTYASVYIPFMANGDVYSRLACADTWSLNQVSFTTGPAANYIYFYVFNFDTTSVKVDDVVLTFGDGTAPQHMVLHAGSRNVRISGQNVMLDGAPFLSLGFYDVGYYDLAQVAATGANTINSYGVYNDTDCFNTGQKSYLDQAYELGLNFLPDSSFAARTQTPAVFPAIAQTFAPHLANIGWYLADEPDVFEVPPDYIPPATFIAESAALKTATSLPVMADFEHAFWGPLVDTAPYNGSADVWMSEPYGPDFSVINYAVNTFNSIQTRPIWFAQDNIDAGLIVPKAYWAVIAGATGIHYYNWNAFKSNPATLAAATQVFTELKGLNNAIFGQTIDSLVSAPAGIASMSRFDPGSGSAYILAANSTAQNIHGNFFAQGLAAGQQITVLYENRTITANAGSFSDTFAGVSRHVYQIQTATTALTASLISESGSTTSRDWRIQVFNSGLVAANSAQITGVALTQTGGTPCAPAFAPGAFPLALGNIAPSQSAIGDVIINFAGCGSTAKFTVKLTLAANNGATIDTVVRTNERI